MAGALGAGCGGQSSPPGAAGGSTSIDFPDASADSIFPPDASTGPVESDACWASSLLPPDQPIPPHTTVTDACAIGAAATSTDWLYPSAQTSTEDDRKYIVGRWAVCNMSIFGLTPHAGLEFGPNGRWRMLATDATTGDLVPMARLQTTSGYYDLLGTGHLTLVGELTGGGYHIYSVTFTAALDAIKLNDSADSATEVYARTTPSPLNGADNPPPTSAGPCSLVGDWDLPPNTGLVVPATVFSFDAAGNFVVNLATANICTSTPQATTYSSTYSLSPGVFQVIGGSCAVWNLITPYKAVFDASCNHLSVDPQSRKLSLPRRPGDAHAPPGGLLRQHDAPSRRHRFQAARISSTRLFAAGVDRLAGLVGVEPGDGPLDPLGEGDLAPASRGRTTSPCCCRTARTSSCRPAGRRPCRGRAWR